MHDYEFRLDEFQTALRAVLRQVTALAAAYGDTSAPIAVVDCGDFTLQVVPS
jgi:hypothetical protein